MSKTARTAIILLFVMAMAASILQAQQQLRVTFKVIDSVTKKPVEGVKLVTYEPDRPNTRWDATSDAEGKAIITGMSPGRITIEATREGYINFRGPIRLRTGQPRLDITLEIAPIIRQSGEITPKIRDRFNEGMKLFQEQKFEEAAAIFQAIVDEYPDLNQVNVNLGTVYFQMDEFEKAIEYLNKALENDPDNADIRSRIADCYLRMNRTEDAFLLFKEVADKNPEDKYAIGKTANLAQNMDDYDTAIVYYRKLLALDDTDPWSHLYLGTLLYLKDQLEEAVTVLEKYVELDPDNQTGALDNAKIMLQDIKDRLEKQ